MMVLNLLVFQIFVSSMALAGNPSVTRQLIEAHQSQFNDCYVKSKTSRSGEVRLRIHYQQETGIIGRVGVDQTDFNLPELENCILAVAKTLQFSAEKGHPGLVEIRYPIKLGSNSSAVTQ